MQRTNFTACVHVAKHLLQVNYGFRGGRWGLQRYNGGNGWFTGRARVQSLLNAFVYEL